MSEDDKIGFLIRLLDDDSPVVQEALGREFLGFGPGLHARLAGVSPALDDAALARIQQLVGEEARRSLRTSWEAWLGSVAMAPLERLEAAFTLIADFQNGPGHAQSLGGHLDGLEAEFRRRGGTVDEETLARFLFKEKGLEGDRSNYYHPQNSNLVYVIESRRGLPISLACVYMLVGRRLGLNIGGCNWPHHFFARIVLRRKIVLVDCFNGGRMLDRESFLKMQGPSREAAEAVLDEAASVEQIVSRVLGNLVRAYQQVSHEANSRLMLDLLRETERHFGARR